VEQESLVTAYCSFFVGGGLGKARKNLAYFSLAATAAVSIHPSIQVMSSLPVMAIEQCKVQFGGGCNEQRTRTAIGPAGP
jgi:hypothetical protein